MRLGVLFTLCVAPPPGGLGGPSGVSGEGQTLVPGRHRELGGGVRAAEPARSLHTGHQVHRLDQPADQRTGLTDRQTDKTRQSHRQTRRPDGSLEMDDINM